MARLSIRSLLLSGDKLVVMMKILLFFALTGLAFGRPGNGRPSNAIWVGEEQMGSRGSRNSYSVISVGSSQTFQKTGAGCGQSTFMTSPSQISTFIVGGQNAQPGEFPWQVGIIEKGYLICGGTYVIGKDGNIKVITAAHCVEGRRRHYSVVFGMHRTGDTNDRVVAAVSRLIRHPNYNSISMSNDIAILEVSSITENDLAGTFASPICLASRSYTAGEMAVVSGWGTTSEGGSSPDTLKYVWKPILSYNYCNTQTGNAGELDSSMMCSGETGIDACQGDSGGPLAANRDGNWELVGVVSWGYGCGRANHPGVYADVWALRSWIEANY